MSENRSEICKLFLNQISTVRSIGVEMKTGKI